MDLHQAIAVVERGNLVGADSPVEPGERTVVICSGGEKHEGSIPPCLYNSIDDAVSYWLRGITLFAARHPGDLCWRTRPEMNSVRVGKNRYFYVYSRLAIKDNKLVTPGKSHRPVSRQLLQREPVGHR